LRLSRTAVLPAIRRPAGRTFPRGISVDSTLSIAQLSTPAPGRAPPNPPWQAVTQPAVPSPGAGIVYLLDIDNTLLDGDRMVADLRQHLEAEFSIVSAERFWSALETLRAELGFVDYLGALQRYRNHIERSGMDAQRLLSTSAFLIDYPYAERLYPRSLEAIRHLDRTGQTVILSDGDVALQPRKVQRSGLWDAVDGRVLIHVHKERMLDSVKRRYPARHYVMVDDELRILAAMKANWKEQLTTVFLRQGSHAADPANINTHTPADITIESLDDLIDLDPARLAPAG